MIITPEILNKIDKWTEEDAKLYVEAIRQLGREPNINALTGRKSGYFIAIRNVLENPEKFGLQFIP